MDAGCGEQQQQQQQQQSLLTGPTRFYPVSRHTSVRASSPFHGGSISLDNLPNVVTTHSQLSRPMLSRHHVCMGPRWRMLFQGNRQILPLWYVLKMCFADMPGDAWRQPKGATRTAFTMIQKWCIATPSNDISRPPRHNHSQIIH